MKFKPQFGIGIRYNRYLSGTHFEYDGSEYTDPNVGNSYRYIEERPLSKGNYCQMPRNDLQISYGVSIWPHKQLELNISKHMGSYLGYEKVQAYPLSCFNFFYGFRNSDLNVSLKYHFKLGQ